MAEQIIVRQEQEEEEEEGGKSKSVDVDLGGGGGGGGKAARLPRWTRQEILVLIQGKRVAESRVRRGRSSAMVNMNNNNEGGEQGHEVMMMQQQQQVEPKWATVSSYCKRHGVNRGPVQCRKRWSNLAGDYKKIKEWEASIKDESESFWLMRNDFRRDRKLPGFFDKEVFDILNSNSNNNNNNNSSNCGGGGVMNVGDDHVKGEAVFDSGRSATAEDGLFSDFEQAAQQRQQQRRREQEEEVMMGGSPDNEVEEGEGEDGLVSSIPTAIPAPTPISEKQYQPMNAEAATGPGRDHEKQRDRLNPESGSTSREGRKRRRFSEEDEGDDAPLQDQLVQVLEKNGRIISSQLDAYNINLKLDREERKDHATSLVAVLNKLADSLGRIADKL